MNIFMVTVWIFSWYDANNDFKMKIIKDEKQLQRHINGFDKNGHWYSITEVEVKTK